MADKDSSNKQITSVFRISSVFAIRYNLCGNRKKEKGLDKQSFVCYNNLVGLHVFLGKRGKRGKRPHRMKCRLDRGK